MSLEPLDKGNKPRRPSKEVRGFLKFVETIQQRFQSAMWHMDFDAKSIESWKQSVTKNKAKGVLFYGVFEVA